MLFCPHKKAPISIWITHSVPQAPISSLFQPSCLSRSLLGAFPSSFTLQLANLPSPPACSLPSQSCTDVNLNLCRLPSSVLSAPMSSSHPLGVLFFCLYITIYSRLVPLCLLFCSHNHALTSIWTSADYNRFFRPGDLFAFFLESFSSGFTSQSTHVRSSFVCSFAISITHWHQFESRQAHISPFGPRVFLAFISVSSPSGFTS